MSEIERIFRDYVPPPVISYEHVTRLITLPIPKAYTGESEETDRLVELFREGLKVASGELPSELPIERIVHMNALPLAEPLPTLHLDAMEFARLVESAQIFLRKGRDDSGLLLLADAKPIDLAEGLRAALIKVVADRFRVTVDDWDKITSRALVGPGCDPLLGLLVDRWYSHQNAVPNV